MADPTETPNTPPADAAAPASAPAADVQAEINKALAAQQAQFQTQLKELTGHDSLKAFHEAQLSEQGKLKELADAKTQEAHDYKTRFEQSQIKAALLSAASGAVDPDTVHSLLASGAAVDEAGNVTINGKPASEAVSALLEAKPFLAKPQGGSGSGAPHHPGAKPSLTRAAFDALDASARAKFIRDGGNVVG